MSTRPRKKRRPGKNRTALRPVIIEGSVLARTWWGKAWNESLESYADYKNVIGRGRSSVRSGAIVDLQVSAGEIKALVQGSRAKPYAVTITINKLNRNTWNQVSSACKGKLNSLEELLAGKFPKALEETFMRPKTGLFPSPGEIEFRCSCPDWASMCKHIAGTLYGIGARLDEDPTLFFTLRGVAAVDLVERAVAGKAEDLFQKGSKKSSMQGAHGSAVFDGDHAGKAGSSPAEDAADKNAQRREQPHGGRSEDPQKTGEDRCPFPAERKAVNKIRCEKGRQGNRENGCEQTGKVLKEKVV